MSLQGWRNNTIRHVAQVLGPAAEIIVDDTIEKNGFSNTEMVPITYLKFLEALYRELPDDVDRKALCLEIRDAVLKEYGADRK